MEGIRKVLASLLLLPAQAPFLPCDPTEQPQWQAGEKWPRQVWDGIWMSSARGLLSHGAVTLPGGAWSSVAPSKVRINPPGLYLKCKLGFCQSGQGLRACISLEVNGVEWCSQAVVLLPFTWSLLETQSWSQQALQDSDALSTLETPG